MFNIIFVFLALFPILLIGRPSTEDLIILNESTFAKTIETNPYVVVMFYADWCYWSKQALPEISRVARSLKIHNPPVVVAKVNGPENPLLMDRYSVKNFPVISIFADGKSHIYTGPRTTNEIVNYVNDFLDRDHILLSLNDITDHLIHHEEIVVLGIYSENEKNKSQSLERVSRRFDENILFSETHHPEALQHIRGLMRAANITLPTAPPAIVMSFPHEPKFAVFSGNLNNVDELESFINANRMPDIVHFTPMTALLIFTDGRPITFLVTDSEVQNNNLQDVYRKVAITNKEHMIFVSSGNKEAWEKRLLDIVGVDDETVLPTIRAVTANAASDGFWHPAHKYAYETDLEDETKMNEWINGFLDDELTPFLKSEPVPESQPGPVHVVVGTTFLKTVNDKTKDVLVEFYAPWCGHCRKLAPAYNEVGRKFKHDKRVIIAKMDASRNEIEGITIRGYPTIYFYPANRKKDPIEFTGPRDAASISKFVKENSNFGLMESSDSESSTLFDPADEDL
eukprot:GHVL01028824.1.p1 GENE.GHVL01028824.1~~GHVL01028824.1.p1  ORF type:complete len:512 (+),score=81.59 GHVL01028824.1:61-1596(+)